MHMLSQFRQTGDGANQVITKADRMRRGKTQTFQPVDRADGFEQLHEGTLPVTAVYHRRFFIDVAPVVDRRCKRKFVAAIQVHDLPEKRHLLHTARDESANFRDDFSNGAATFRSACGRHDAKGAMHIAALHDGNERGGLLGRQRLFTNRGLRTSFFLYVHNRITRIIHAAEAWITDPARGTFVQNQIIDVVGYTMKFLCADHKIKMRNFLQQFRAARLGHAAKKSKYSFRAVLADTAEHP